MYAQSTKDKAIMLRREGYTYSLILKEVGVAKSTLSEWLKGIPFTPNGIARDLVEQGQKKSKTAKKGG